MSAVANNSHTVVVDNETEVYMLARRRPAAFPGFVFCNAKQLDDGTWQVFFVREEAMKHAYRELVKRWSN